MRSAIIFTIIYSYTKEIRINFFIHNRRWLLFVVTLQESFIAIVPFFLLTSLITLYYYFISYLHLDLFGFSEQSIRAYMILLQSFSSLVAVVSIAYFFANRFKVSQIVAITLAIAIYVTLILFESTSTSPVPLEMPYGFNQNVLLMPILSTYLLKRFYPYLSLQLTQPDGNHHIYELFNYIFIFFISYFTVLIIDLLLDYLIYHSIANINLLENPYLPDIIILAIRNLLVDALWFLGIHGEHTINGIFGKEILFKELFENLTYGEFNRIFVLLGGAGVGLGILISLLLHAQEQNIRTITKISIPFVLFNINTLLIYAVVVLNRFLLLPFLFLPLANLIIAYVTLPLLNIDFSNYYVVWTTPTFVDGYLKTNGNLWVVYLQMILLIFDIMVYNFFVKKFLASQSFYYHVEHLQKNLNLKKELKSTKHIASFQAQKDIIEANIQLQELIEQLHEKNLFVYYQPKVNIKTHQCSKFEALLRYRKNNQLMGPVFLDTLEKAGLAHIIDLWVCLQVKKDLHQWKKREFYPTISINIHPDTLKSTQTMHSIMNILENERIDFEMIERSFLFQTAKKNLNTLHDKGFGLSIDDFGTGYSSLETMVHYQIKELKLDKSLIDIIHTKKGFYVCQRMAQLCHDLEYIIVAEGVETPEQLALVQQINIDLVQGFYFSKAIHFNEVMTFAHRFEQKHYIKSRR